MEKIKKLAPIIFFLLISIFFLLSFAFYVKNGYLLFSDGAKFADIASNLVEKNQYGSSFSFFSKKVFKHSKDGLFTSRGVPLLMPYSMALFFKLFGVSDLSVMLTSSFYFLGLVLAVYFLGKRLYGPLVGFLSAIAIASNINFLDYATSGASETLFSFLVVTSVYLLFIKSKWRNSLFVINLISLYLARPQGVLFIFVLVFAWFVKKFSFAKAAKFLIFFVLGLYVFDKYVLYPLSWKTNVYPIFTRGIQAFLQHSSGSAVSDSLRGGFVRNVDILSLAKKLFYNLYNFYKLLPEIASPYMWGLFLVGLVGWGKDKTKNLFKLLTFLFVISNFVLVALTIPFFRYLHPVVPLVYIVATGTLVKIVRVQITKKNYVIFTSSLLILLFSVGQSLGVIFLDSRFEAKALNKEKAPVYVELSYILKENTGVENVVITNLDTWGSWYGERKTVWFPLTPEMLDINEDGNPPFDAIYLTDYRIDDENYYMGEAWREIFNDPIGHSNELVLENYEFVDEYSVSAEDTYENESARAILLVRKSD